MDPLYRKATTSAEDAAIHDLHNSPSFPVIAQSSPVADPSMATGASPASPASLLWNRRVALNQLTTLPLSLGRDLDEYSRHGIAGIGLNWRKLTEAGLRRSIRQLQKVRMPVSSLGWIGGFTGENGYSLNDVLTEGRRIIRVAGQIRASTVTVITGPQAGHIRPHAVRLVVDGLRELSELAATYQVQLVLQPMHSMFARNWSFVNTLDEGLQILDRVGDPRVKLAFGSYHLWEEPNLTERLEAAASRIGLVTLADWSGSPRHENDRLLPGEGQLPLAEIVAALERQHYSGWYELEVWSRDLWKLEARDLMRRCVAAREKLSAQVAAN